MTTFVLTSFAGSVITKQNQILNTINQTPIGNFLQKDKWKEDRLSPRLRDLTIQTSTYNEVIPIVYGKNRLAGNIIWATDIKEVERVRVTSSGGGKGSPKVHQTHRSYYYYVNLAIAICKGEVNELYRVWADTVLLDLSKYKYRFYTGTKTQNPDFLIQAHQGVGKTPAYRNLCYIVFEEFPLSEFGNRIPNFTFEITRNPKTEIQNSNKLENLIEAINVIPGCGEFVYDTIVHFKKEGIDVNGSWIEYGKKTRINQNNNNNKADSLVSFDQLQTTLPNCKWIAPVVTWFGNNLDVCNCFIKPRVEYGNDSEGYPIYTEPTEWRVGNWTRFNTPIVGKDNNTLRYGGTISDTSVINYLKEARNRNFKIMFYPMFFMDIPNKPWRGRLTGSAENIKNFFTKTNGYNEFILHYANLVKDYIDVFIIGSELIGLTCIKTEQNTFPAVDQLIDLASKVRLILGSNVKVSYAADWSEYHHTKDGWYNLDKLWASSDIDFIGIDAYFPLTDKKQNLITKQDIIDGWTSGEGYDWYYKDQNRSIRSDLSPEYAWKNIEWWWKNKHINPNGEETEWIPESKKIWFTEYGFASVDGTSNEPNKFYDPGSIDGGFPRFSEGQIDFFAQRQALKATEEKWQNSSMIERRFVWCWDARPYPFYPNNLALWSDGNLWKYGHWLNGKLGKTTASELVLDILKQIQIKESIIGKIDIYDDIEGVTINNQISILNFLNILQKVYFFDCIESNGLIKFFTKKTESIITINENELITLRVEKDRDVFIETEIIDSNKLPKRLDVNFINKNFNYQIGNVYAEKTSEKSDFLETINLPVVLSELKAKSIAEIALYSHWSERIIYSFVLPIKYLCLESGDVITLIHNNFKAHLRIINLILKNNTIETKAVKFNGLFSKIKTREIDSEANSMETILSSGQTDLKIFELPSFNASILNKPIIYFSVNSQEGGWRGCALYNSKNGGGSFDFVDETRSSSLIGKCCNVLGNANPYYFDYKNTLIVYFGNEENIDLENVDNLNLFTGTNLALVGNEILQFKKIELQSNGTYKISELLRGLFGTENEISQHKLNDNFIILNKKLLTIVAEEFDIGLLSQYKAVSFGEDLSEAEGVNYKITGQNLKPLPPVHLQEKRDKEGNINLNWKRRSRGYNGWRDCVDVPLIEKIEKYEIDVFKNEKVVRTISVIEKNSCNYNTDLQIEDFNELPNIIKIKIYQISDIVGRGFGYEKIIKF